MPRPRLHALALLSTLAGCAQGVIGDDPVQNFGTFAETGVETMMPTVEGQRWCANLPNPHGCVDPGGSDAVDPWLCSTGDQVDINEAPFGTDPKGCMCAPPEINNYLTGIESGGEAVVDDSEPVFIRLFRDAIYEDAEEKCETFALGQLTIPPDFHNCEYAITQHLDANPGDFPGLVKEGQVGDCSAAADFEGDTTAAGMHDMPGDSYKDYYSLSSVIVWSQTHSRYDVDAGFFDDLLNNPAWLFEDSARVEWDGSKYVLSGVSSGTIAYALGLQNGDQPLTLNNWSLETIAKMLDAHHGLQGLTSYSLVVKRSGNNVTINYSVR